MLLVPTAVTTRAATEDSVEERAASSHRRKMERVCYNGASEVCEYALERGGKRSGRMHHCLTAGAMFCVDHERESSERHRGYRSSRDSPGPEEVQSGGLLLQNGFQWGELGAVLCVEEARASAWSGAEKENCW